jgi:uncharacterized protein
VIAHFILYVKDQERSSAYYSKVLGLKPTLDVPGMTEFQLGETCILGLMPESGIKRLLGNTISDPAQAQGIPRAELYLRVDDPVKFHNRALEAGAVELSGPTARDWGDLAAYSLDLDSHILAFAKTIESSTPQN